MSFKPFPITYQSNVIKLGNEENFGRDWLGHFRHQKTLVQIHALVISENIEKENLKTRFKWGWRRGRESKSKKL